MYGKIVEIDNFRNSNAHYRVYIFFQRQQTDVCACHFNDLAKMKNVGRAVY